VEELHVPAALLLHHHHHSLTAFVLPRRQRHLPGLPRLLPRRRAAAAPDAASAPAHRAQPQLHPRVQLPRRLLLHFQRRPSRHDLPLRACAADDDGNLWRRRQAAPAHDQEPGVSGPIAREETGLHQRAGAGSGAAAAGERHAHQAPPGAQRKLVTSSLLHCCNKSIYLLLIRKECKDHMPFT
jgi:hypothetical protein